MRCASGLHDWGDDRLGATRCCNGWCRELRLDGAQPNDDARGRVAAPECGPQAVIVWVRMQRAVA